MAATLTRDQAYAQLRAWMVDQIGTREKPHGSNKQKYGKKYGWNGVPWCAQFSWCGAQAIGLSSKEFPKTASVAAVKAFAIKTGRWGHKPRKGAYFLYPGGSSHIGWVEKVLPGGRIQTIEGNTNDDGSRDGYEVCRRIRSASNMGGYFYVRLGEAKGAKTAKAASPASAAKAANPDAPAAKPSGTPGLSRVLKARTPLMKGADVRRVQRALHRRGRENLKVDGEFGEQTAHHVKGFQANHDLKADGEVGPKTARALGFAWKG